MRTNSQACSLVAHHTFDNFVVCESNAQGAEAVRQRKEGAASDILWLWGDGGNEKTHLMHALGNAVLLNNPQERVACISAERFDAFLRGSQTDREAQELRRSFHAADVLLVDDVQFLEERVTSQVALFEIASQLAEKGARVVFTCNRSSVGASHTQSMKRVQLIEVGAPDLEARVAILNRWAEKEAIVLPVDVAMYLAESFTTNVRAMVGLLIKAVAYHRMKAMPIDVRLLSDIMDEARCF